MVGVVAVVGEVEVEVVVAVVVVGSDNSVGSYRVTSVATIIQTISTYMNTYMNVCSVGFFMRRQFWSVRDN